MQLSSKLIEEAVDQISSLPGIGRKTALRLVLHLLKRESEDLNRFTRAITNMHSNINYCQECNNLSDSKLCSICSNPNRDSNLVCVVEDIRDVMAIESTQQFRGKYHVLGGIISPMDGIGPNDLFITQLIDKVESGIISEVILALSTTMEGETTAFYLFKKINNSNVKVTTIARGVAIGDELEYTDEITLGRSIINRTSYENSLSS